MEEDPFEAFDMRVSRPSIQTSQQISEVKSHAHFVNADILARNANILLPRAYFNSSIL